MTIVRDIQKYIDTKCNIIADMREVGRVVFGKLESSLIDHIGDVDLDCRRAGYLAAALTAALEEPDDRLSSSIVSQIRTTYEATTAWLDLEDVHLNACDFSDYKTGHPCGFVQLRFRPRAFEAEVLSQLQLTICEPTFVTWEYRVETPSNPRLTLPVMYELELDDLIAYHKAFNSTWHEVAAWSKLQGGSSLIVWP